MQRRVRNLLASASALLLFIGLAFAAVTLTRPGETPVPVQHTGTAAGRPHRVSAAADSGRVVDGKFVPDVSPEPRDVAGPATRSPGRVPGAVPSASRPKQVKFPLRGKAAPETATPLKAPAPVRKTGYDAETSRELPLTSADQATYANADGTKTAFRFEYPVNYRRPDGSWAAISTNLVPAAKTASVAAASASPAASGPVTPAPSPSMVPSALASPSASSSPSSSYFQSPSGSVPSAPGWREQSEAAPESFAGYANAANLVSVPVGNNQEVSFGIMKAASAAGSVTGGTVTYAGVRPGASVSFSAGTGMVKEDIVLSSPAAPESWVFPLDLKGLQARMGPAGVVEFTDPAGMVVAYMPHGFMEDSDVNPHSGDGAISDGVTYSLVTVNGRRAVKMTLDTAWLDSESRVYPVTVDPSVKDEGSNGTTYAQTGDQDADHSGSTEIHVGTYDGGGSVSKSFLSFGNVSSGLEDDTVLGARLGVFNTWSYSCSPRTVYIYPVTSPWSKASISWPGPSTGGAVGSKTFATGWVPYGSSSSPCPASWEGISLNQAGTNLVNGWTHGTKANYGLALGASGSDNYAWKKFASDSSPAGDPFLAVTYTTDGASYKLASRKPVVQVTPSQAGKIAVRVTNTGASTWDANNANGYEISYRAYGPNGNLVATPRCSRSCHRRSLQASRSPSTSPWTRCRPGRTRWTSTCTPAWTGAPGPRSPRRGSRRSLPACSCRLRRRR